MTDAGLDGGSTDPGDDLPLEVEEFLAWLAVERGRSPATLRAYRTDLRAYVAWLGATPPSAAGEEHVTGWVAHLRQLGRAPASVARGTVSVRGLHRFLAADDLAPVDAAADVEVPRVPMGAPKALSRAQVDRLLAAPAGDEPLTRRDRAIVEVLYGAGLRISELVGLSLGDVDLDDRLLRVLGKGSRERVVPIGRYAADAVSGWLSGAGRGAVLESARPDRADLDAVFLNARGGRLSRQGAWLVVRRLGDRVGLGEELTPHVLRHSCATHLLEGGADIRAVQELLGHVAISTTQRYTAVTQSHLRQVYDDSHPRARIGPAPAGR